MYKVITLATATAMLFGCSALTGSTATPLTPAQLQQDLNQVLYLMKTAGCLTSTAAAAATPVISVAADSVGNQILAAVTASGAVLCSMVVPPTALPVPAPVNAPAASTTPAV